jgi:hypothetical protein
VDGDEMKPIDVGLQCWCGRGGDVQITIKKTNQWVEVSHATACLLFGAGNLPKNRHEIVEAELTGRGFAGGRHT